MKKSLSKKFLNAVLSMAIILIITAISFVVGSEIKFANNSSKAQTFALEKLLDVDGGYRQSNFGRLQHNNNEPIYIIIEDKTFTNRQLSMIDGALEMLFNLVGDVNENYRYQIIDDKTKVDLTGKSNIKFTSEKLGNANGCAKRNSSILSFGSKGVFNQTCQVVYDKCYLKMGLDHFYYTTVHELLHIFGLEDVYDGNVNYLNTFMNVRTNDILKMITPNDYKLLVALYAKDYSRLNESDKLNYIQYLQQKVEDYSIEYYKNFQECTSESLNALYSTQGFSSVESEVMMKFNFAQDRFSQKITVEAGEKEYNIFAYSSENELIDQCSGRVYKLNGEYFLQGVHLNMLKEGKETFADLHITSSETENAYCLKDLFFNVYSTNGLTV